MAIKVIGSGMGRTGTLSLKYALEELGFGKCYHMFELLVNHPDHVAYFEKAERGEPVNWDEMFTGFQSAVDFPVAKYYEQLIKYYPEAKIIHTMREPASWYKSASETILKAKPPLPVMLKMAFRSLFSPELRKKIRVFQYIEVMVNDIFGKNLTNKQAILNAYNKFNDEALRKLPRERLLVYYVKDGWEPLCKFLNVPVPSTPFPKVNTTEEFHQNAKEMRK